MLERTVQLVNGVGPKKSLILKTEAGIETIEDLLYYAPRKYMDRSSFKPIKDTFVGETVTIAGVITKIELAGKKKPFLKVEISDDTDTLCGVFFRGLQYFHKIFTLGDFVLFSGKIDFFKSKQIIHPDFDFIDEDSQIKSINTGRIIPLYPSSEKLKRYGFDSRGFRRIIRNAIDISIDNIDDSLDQSLLQELNLLPLKEALLSIHFPDSLDMAEMARKRLAFNELFFIQYYLALSRRQIKEEYKNKKNKIDDSYHNKLIESLPFQLTQDQINAIKEIRADLENPFPMNRLLQGDVGCGKTVVALASALLVKGMGLQTAIMAPTEILAEQHYNTFKKLSPGGAKITLLKSNMPQSEKKKIYKEISSGEIDIAIGTHALIQEKVEFANLGFIVIDEQHRFGVRQRAALRDKGISPDLLIMTATPIPRSLSLTLYGDLDISYIRQKPADRKPVKTLIFPQSKLDGVYNSVNKYLSMGRQAYFVFPLIQESEKIDLKSAEEAYIHLKQSIFSKYNVDILHGKMPSSEKDLIMRKFKDGETDVLVTTTIIEVGIDVANATIMVIEHAERFGLAQLHQLRGRVGRGEHQSFCVLSHADDAGEDSMARINALASNDDGFKIAEEDLKLRGAGDIIGTRQHGLNNGFEFTDIITDIELILTAKEKAGKAVMKIENIEEVIGQINQNKHSSVIKGIRSKKILSILS